MVLMVPTLTPENHTAPPFFQTGHIIKYGANLYAAAKAFLVAA
jgi:hypothetical protein